MGDMCIWKKTDENLISVTYDYAKRNRRQDFDFHIVENGSIYIFRPNSMLKFNNRLFGKIGCSLMEDWKIFEIDNIDDLKICEMLYREKIHQ